jgi:DNA-binding MarR family transcriptional regulator
MNASTTARQRLLQYFDQCDRERPGDFTVAGAAIEALEGLDVHTALQELRRLGRDGQLELVGAPIGVVHGLTYVRITNKGRKAGECATDRDARTSVLHYIATHAPERPTRIDSSPQELQLTETEAYRALLSLAASGLITHSRVGRSLGLVQITPRGRNAIARLLEEAPDGAVGESSAHESGQPARVGPARAPTAQSAKEITQ